MNNGEDGHLIDRIDALDRLIQSELASIRREISAYTLTSERAITMAASEARDRLSSHNRMIEQMREQATHFATREVVDLNRDAYLKRFEGIERFQSRVTGALVLIAVGMPVLTLLFDRLLSK